MSLWVSKGFISPEFFLNFFQNLEIPQWLRKNFNLWCYHYLLINLWLKKLNLFIFIHAPKKNSAPGFDNYHSDRRKLSILAKQHFLKIYFSPAGRVREDYGVEKTTKIKPTRVLLTSFTKFHHLFNLYIFGFCFVVP